ncbi:MAG: hypothetical protein KKB13_03335 [Chloroflexi bacterium]|nr:hypothetical protein [Chloroflexota bacterium]
MQGQRRLLIGVLILGLLLAPATGLVLAQGPGPQGGDVSQASVGTAFTYQGRLQDTGGPVTSDCDLQFSLWDSASNPTGQVGAPLTKSNVSVSGGLFTVELDFGAVFAGDARWLQVAVRCPAGSGSYSTLSPRQKLTAAPAALSLALPFLAEANIGGPLACFENEGAGEAAVFSSAGGYALWVGTAGLDALYVASAGQDGVHVIDAGGRGVAVDTAGGDGVYVGAAGTPTSSTPSDYHNGVEVAGAEWYGLYVGNAGFDGLHIGSAGGNGVGVDSTGWSGFFVNSADYNGFHVSGAGGNGLLVGHTGADGVLIGQAGSPSSWTWSDYNNGFEIAGAQGHGLYVGRADDTGVFVHSAGWNGVVVEEAGGDGVRATATVYNALYGDTANAQGEWGLYTPDKVHAQNVTLQTLTLIAQVSGPDALSPGDVVAAAGVAAPLPGNSAPLPRVRLAGANWNGVVGVVEGRLALTPVPQPEGKEEQRLELRSAEGPARPGDYVALTVLGLARVKVDAGQGAIQPGTRLTSGAGGWARALKTVVVEGVTLAESAPVLGIALDAPDENGLVWVLVNPQ